MPAPVSSAATRRLRIGSRNRLCQRRRHRNGIGRVGDAVGAPDLADASVAHGCQRFVGEQRMGHGHIHTGGACGEQGLRGAGDGVAGAGHVIQQDRSAILHRHVRQRDFHAAITVPDLAADRVVKAMPCGGMGDPLS